MTASGLPIVLMTYARPHAPKVGQDPLRSDDTRASRANMKGLFASPSVCFYFPRGAHHRSTTLQPTEDLLDDRFPLLFKVLLDARSRRRHGVASSELDGPPLGHDLLQARLDEGPRAGVLGLVLRPDHRFGCLKGLQRFGNGLIRERRDFLGNEKCPVRTFRSCPGTSPLRNSPRHE